MQPGPFTPHHRSAAPMLNFDFVALSLLLTTCALAEGGATAA